MSKEDLWLEVSRIKLSLDEKLEELENLSVSLMEVMDELEEEEEEKSVVPERGEKPKEGEDYWTTFNSGDIASCTWWNSTRDLSIWEKRFINHMSTNKEYVEFMQERDRIRSKLAEKARPFRRLEDNWCIGCEYSDYGKATINSGIDSYFQPAEFYFESIEVVRNLIEEIGEENLIKYYFMAG